MADADYCKKMIKSTNGTGRTFRCFTLLDKNGLCPNCDSLQRWHNKKK